MTATDKLRKLAATPRSGTAWLVMTTEHTMSCGEIVHDNTYRAIFATEHEATDHFNMERNDPHYRNSKRFKYTWALCGVYSVDSTAI